MQITQLDNKKSISNLVEVDTDKAILDFITVELEKDEFNFIVTADNIQFAKTKMADLNKSIKFIDTFRKDKVAVESVAINSFKENVKTYIALIETKREKLKKDVEVFEREQKDMITKELSLYSEQVIKSQNIRDNFIDVNIVDLIVLGSVTSKGSLTKKAKETVESRVMVCKAKQDKYDMRLMKLENLSYQNGLESPLTITHVQGIIYIDSDTEYETRLNELISSEMDRQNIMKASIQKQADEKANREAQQKVLDEQNRIKNKFAVNFNNLTIDSIDMCISDFQNTIASEGFGDFTGFAVEYSNSQIDKLNGIKNDLIQKEELVKNHNVEVVHETIPASVEKQEVPKTESGKKIVKINAVFEVEVPGHVSSEAVLEKVRSRLSECDINSDTLKSLEVV